MKRDWTDVIEFLLLFLVFLGIIVGLVFLEQYREDQCHQKGGHLKYHAATKTSECIVPIQNQ